MSQENVDLVLEGFQLYARDELELAAPWHEDGVLTGPHGWPEEGPFHGPEAIQAQFERLRAEYAEACMTDVEVLKSQDEWVVVRFTWRTRGLASGIESAADMAAAIRVRDGRYLESHYRWHEKDALEAAGLSE